MAETTPAVYSARLEIAHDHPGFVGHFDGFALLPGVALLAETLECVLDQPVLARAIGITPRLANVKFLAPVAPGASLCVTLTPSVDGRLRFALHEGDRVVASGLFEAGAP